MECIKKYIISIKNCPFNRIIKVTSSIFLIFFSSLKRKCLIKNKLFQGITECLYVPIICYCLQQMNYQKFRKNNARNWLMKKIGYSRIILLRLMILNFHYINYKYNSLSFNMEIERIFEWCQIIQWSLQWIFEKSRITRSFIRSFIRSWSNRTSSLL